MSVKQSKRRFTFSRSKAEELDRLVEIVGDEKTIRAKLLGARDEIESEFEQTPATGESMDDVPTLASAAGHVPRDTGVSEVIESRSRQINKALVRLDQGMYGLCAECGDEIPARRLQALPFATLCVACQKVSDRLHPV